MKLLGYQVVVLPKTSKVVQDKLVHLTWESAIKKVFEIAQTIGDQLDNPRIMSLLRESSNEDCIVKGESDIVMILSSSQNYDIIVNSVFAADS
jgi:hypothetical protein